MACYYDVIRARCNFNPTGSFQLRFLNHKVYFAYQMSFTKTQKKEIDQSTKKYGNPKNWTFLDIFG